MTRPPLSRTDPLTPLVKALYRAEYPPLDWVIVWSQGGEDPVAHAWEASQDPPGMYCLLYRYQSPQAADAVMWDVEMDRPLPPEKYVQVVSYELPERVVCARVRWKNQVYERARILQDFRQHPFLRLPDGVAALRAYLTDEVRYAAVADERAEAIRRRVPEPPTMAWVEEYLAKTKKEAVNG